MWLRRHLARSSRLLRVNGMVVRGQPGPTPMGRHRRLQRRRLELGEYQTTGYEMDRGPPDRARTNERRQGAPCVDASR